MKKLLFLFLLFITTSSFACICNDIPFKEAIEWADEILFGRLIEIKEVEFEVNEQYPEEKYTRSWYALFEVDKKWKGSSKKYIKVYQPSTSCDAEFQSLGNYYLVYAKKEEIFMFSPKNKSDVKLTTWLCSRSRQYQGVNEPNNDIELLNKQFSNKVKLNSFEINLPSIICGILIFLLGLFIGTKLKKANLQAL